MNKILFGLLFTFGALNFSYSQENLFDDIDDKHTPNPTQEEFYDSLETPQETPADWDATLEDEEIVTVIEEKPTPVWQATFEETLAKAKAEEKPILIYFTGSDWCGPCKRLETDVFSTEKFIDFSNENMILYKADFPRNTDLVTPENKLINKQLSSRYNQSSFPTMIVINQYGSELGRKNGVYMSDSYFYFFEDIVRRYKI